LNYTILTRDNFSTDAALIISDDQNLYAKTEKVSGLSISKLKCTSHHMEEVATPNEFNVTFAITLQRRLWLIDVEIIHS